MSTLSFVFPSFLYQLAPKERVQMFWGCGGSQQARAACPGPGRAAGAGAALGWVCLGQAKSCWADLRASAWSRCSQWCSSPSGRLSKTRLNTWRPCGGDRLAGGLRVLQQTEIRMCRSSREGGSTRRSWGAALTPELTKAWKTEPCQTAGWSFLI